MNKVHEDQGSKDLKSVKDSDHIDRSMGKNTAVANQEEQVSKADKVSDEFKFRCRMCPTFCSSRELLNLHSHENHQFGAKQNLPRRNQNPRGPRHQTNQRFDPGHLGGNKPTRFGPPPGFPPSFEKSQRPPSMPNNRSQWTPRQAFSSQSRFASPQNSWNSNWKANWNNPGYRQNFNSQVSTRHVGLV